MSRSCCGRAMTGAYRLHIQSSEGHFEDHGVRTGGIAKHVNQIGMARLKARVYGSWLVEATVGGKREDRGTLTVTPGGIRFDQR